MALRSKYMLMKESEVTDGAGKKYPDLATFDINNFIVNTKAIEHKLNYNDCLRFFDLTKSFYGEYDFYDDVTMWLNDILYMPDTDTNFEKTIKLYAKPDIDNWFIKEIP